MPNPLKLLRRHEGHILDAMDELSTRGFCILSKSQLRLWFGQERMSKTIWRELSSKLPEDWSANDVTVFEWEDTVMLIENECTTPMEDAI